MRQAGQNGAGPKLIALDVDGTIVDYDNRLSERQRSVLRAAVDAGHHVVIATGRSAHGALETANRLDLTHGYVVASNGAVLLRLDPELEHGWEVIRAETFDPADALDRMSEVLPTALYMVEDANLVRYASGEFPDNELADMDSMEIVPFDELRAHRATRIVLREPNGTTEEFQEAVERIGLHGVSYAVGWSNWLDIAPDGVSKAHGLEIIAPLLEVDHADTISAGDGLNDLEMLGWTAQSIAMGQARDVVKEAATLVAGPIEEDGLATALESLLEL
ncbi:MULTISPECIES: HAD family hydrolase [Brevibacterium]|jgi:Cof subfamily protein (haloacid dehalogenase superfamily)|uniref:HAD family hydrolase n=1 Tax=Brevibacterium salitolerans TaxID=1403566 RepID=A0ABN2WH46_9MICO|nr:HAD family hydrolase [Brevibacterium sp.]